MRHRLCFGCFFAGADGRVLGALFSAALQARSPFLWLLLLLLGSLCFLHAVASGDSAGLKPACAAACADCQVQPSVAAGDFVILKGLSCPVGQAVVIRRLSFTPWCTSATQCSDVKLGVGLTPELGQGAWRVLSQGDDPNGCFQLLPSVAAPVVLTYQNGAPQRSLSIRVTCSGAEPCLYASMIDVFCQDFLPNHAASGTTARPVSA